MAATLDQTGSPVGPGSGPTQPDISSNITALTQSTPEMKNDPGTAVSVAAGGGDVTLKGQAVQATKTHAAIGAAADDLHKSGLFGDITHDIAAASDPVLHAVSTVVRGGRPLISGVAHLANAPLKTVQQEYRYLHDVEAKHGMTAAMTEGLGLLAGAAVGTVIDPGEGTIAGADAAGWIEGHLSYKDSWAAAANPNYKDPHTGQLVSFGRDIADVLGVKGGGGHTVLSGALDGLFDLAADPVGLAGKAYGSAYEAGGMGGLAGKLFSGTSTATAEDVARASMLPRVKIAFADIAKSDAGTIAVRYPKLSEISETLGEAKTPDEVKDVFMDLAGSMEMMKADTLPTMSLSHLAGRGIRNAARNAGEGALSGIPGSGLLAYAPRSIADNFESLPGNTINPETLDFMKGKLSLTTNDGAQDLYRFVRYGQGDRVGRAVADAWVHGTPGQRLAIYENAFYSTILRMAKMPDMEELDNGATKNMLMEQFRNHVQQAAIEGGDPGKIYGTEATGEPIRGPIMADGTEVPAAITSNQTGDISVPNLVEARRLAQALKSSRLSRVLAKADDFFNDHFTQAFWKPLELMSLGYGLHISAAEAIPNALRNGIVAETNAMIKRSISSMGYAAEENEVDPKGIAGLLYKMGGKGLVKNSDDAEAIIKGRLQLGGEKSPPGLMAGEMTTGETQPVLRAENGLRQLGAVPGYASDDWTQFGNENSKFAELHQQSFRRSANDKWSQVAAKAYLGAGREGKNQIEGTRIAREAVVDALRSTDESELEKYSRFYGKRGTAPDGWDNITDWADTIVSRMKGVVHARPTDVDNKIPGKANVHLLTSLANGHTPEVSEFEKLTPAERPLRVEGQIMMPHGNNLVQKIANVGFKKVLDPMVNGISRNQEYTVEYLKQYKDLQRAVDKGVISDDERVTMANYRSVQNSVRYVHNLTDRTQWTVTLRNWAPFYFAQEQAYRRAGRLLASDPGAFRRYQLTISGVTNVANSYADGNGNQYITFPGSGWLGKGVANAMGMHGLMVGSLPPAQYGGSLSSASIVFPMANGVTPDVGPLGSISGQALTNLFLHLGKDYNSFSPTANVAVNALNAVDGGAGNTNQSILEQLMPNATIERGFELYMADRGGNDRGFNSSVTQTYQMLDYMQAEATAKWIKDGSKGTPPSIIPPQNASAPVKQAFVQKVKNYVTTLYIGRMILGVASPLSAEVEVQDFGMTAKLNEAITKAGSVNAGMTQFLLDNPGGTGYTVSQSFVPGADPTQPSGYSLASSVPAQNWVTQHQGLLDKYGVAALWLMPQLKDSKYSPTVYNEQIADGLRVKDTPAQFLNQLYVAAGNNVYYDNLTKFESALAAAGNDSTAKNAEYNSWNTFVNNLKQVYPVWAENFDSGNRSINANQTITNLKQMFQDNAAPPGEQTTLVKQMLDNYETAATQYADAGVGVSYSAQLSNQSKVSNEWVQYVDNVATQIPALKPIIQSVFKDALKVQTNG